MVSWPIAMGPVARQHIMSRWGRNGSFHLGGQDVKQKIRSEFHCAPYRYTANHLGPPSRPQLLKIHHFLEH